MNRRWILSAMLLLLVLVGCARRQKGAEQQNNLFVSGRIDGDTVDISSKRDGKIVEILVREGDTVQAGQVVARISSPQDEAQVAAQKASVVEDERKLRIFQEKRMGNEVPADSLGDEWKGYVRDSCLL